MEVRDGTKGEREVDGGERLIGEEAIAGRRAQS